MKTYTSSESQSKLNGYYMNYAAILQELTGKVNLKRLKAGVSEYTADIKKLGATEEHAQRAMFFTCNHFDIEVEF